ncbi:glycosyltransferase [Flavobacterium gelidilacus]|uniref:glycosyltransferase n=1 Tax=Flavobacterium gelidilacus TaxID=206041 RepID=UPI00040C6D4C|nr:glycosyltransferase [Flavobacterium gelidilacus]
MNNHLVSIIIPTYNRAHLINETLESIIGQKYSNWECIIVDDGSTDNTKEILKTYLLNDKRFKYFERPLDRLAGGNAARNYGFEKSSGEFIQWFDSDDLMHEDLLGEKVAILIANPECDYCLSKMTAFKKRGNIRINIKETNIIATKFLEDYLRKIIAVGTPTSLWRKSILNKVELFDESLKQSQDLEFHSRIFFNFPNYCFINKSLIFYRTDQNSISNRFFINLEEYLDSFLEVRRRIIKLDKFNKEIALIEIKEILGILRYCLASKRYVLGKKIIVFLRANCNFTDIRVKLEGIFLFYSLFKLLGRGDTKFKFLLKL